MHKLLLSVIAFFVSNGILFAEPNETSSSSSKRIKVEVEIKDKRISDRPKAPSMQQIECYYDGQKFEIEFLYPEGQCRFVVMDVATGEVYEQTFSSEFPSVIYLDGIDSPVIIEIYTGYGHVYEGYLM